MSQNAVGVVLMGMVQIYCYEYVDRELMRLVKNAARQNKSERTCGDIITIM